MRPDRGSEFRSARRRWIAAVLLCVAAPLHAQLRLQVPQVPPLQPALPVQLPDAVESTLDRGVRDLSQLRRLQVRDLLRRHRALIDTDRAGAPVIRGEIVAIDPDPAALQRLHQAGFAVHGESALDALQLRLVRLRAPPGLGTRAALALAQRLDPQGSYDYHHLVWRSGTAVSTAVPAPSTPGAVPASTPSAGDPASAGGDAAPLRVGLVDGGVDPRHPALVGTELHAWGCEDRAVPDPHGTAVASLLAGTAVAAPRERVRLYAADVYCARPDGGGVVEVARALAWLADEEVGVINLSLVGPPNRLLERAVAAVIARGHLVVAAVGNDGPAAPPLYPASYPGVVGVTAVNARDRLLPESARGPQVDFAAPGADMLAAAPQGAWVPVRGTSYAAPIVARLAARLMDRPAAGAADSALTGLARRATYPAGGKRDLYGRGLVGGDLRIARATAAR